MSWMKPFRHDVLNGSLVFWWSIPCHTTFSHWDAEVFICLCGTGINFFLVFADKVFLEPILHVSWRSTDTRLRQVRLLAHLEVPKRPLTPSGPRGDGHGVAWLHAAPAAFLSSVLVHFRVHGAAGHNRWKGAERQPPAKTQGRNMDRSLSTGALCGRVSFKGLQPKTRRAE